jgi:hypothetical protein
MSLRALVMNSLMADSTLGATVKAFWNTNSVDTPQDDERPFVILRWEDLIKGSAELIGSRITGAGTQNLSLWAHDASADYAVIDSILERAKIVLTGMVGMDAGNGRMLMQVDWQGDSPDLIDDGFHTLTRYSRYVVAQGWR